MISPLTTTLPFFLLLCTPLSIAASLSSEITLGHSLTKISPFSNATFSHSRLHKRSKTCSTTKRAAVLKRMQPDNISPPSKDAESTSVDPPPSSDMPPAEPEPESPEEHHDDSVSQDEGPVAPPYEEPSPPAWEGLKPVQYWEGSNFLDGFEFFTADDPTHGQVDYVDGNQARNEGLAYTDDRGNTILRVDNTSWLDNGASRKSVRITSLQPMMFGSVLVLDADKMPFGDSVWPAFWTVGTGIAWPWGGEIDIVEGVHNQQQNMMALHTGNGCRLEYGMEATGEVLGNDCNVEPGSLDDGRNLGCGVRHDNPHSFGEAFNSKGGGVYVMSWNDNGISIWMFHRDNIPQDIANKAPKFEGWGSPAAHFSSASCDMKHHFTPQTIVINLTLCGDWAGGTLSTCSELVTSPRNYDNAFFSIRSVAVYQ